jgi:hypothetical protein
MRKSANGKSLRDEIVAYHRDQAPNNEPAFAAHLLGEECPSVNDLEEAYCELEKDRIVEAADVVMMVNRNTGDEWIQARYRLVGK